MKSSKTSVSAPEEQAPSQQQQQQSVSKGTSSSTSASKDKNKPTETNDNNDKKPQRRVPVRPNLLRKQPVVLPGGVISLPVVAGQNVVGSQQQAAIDLAGVATSVPRRPARLPAAYAPSRYSTLPGSRQTLDLDKPNRYSSWAQRGPALVGHQAVRGAAKAGGLQSKSGGAHFSSHLSSAASRVFVVNPMHIVNISEHTKSRLIKIIEALKRFSEKWFSHVLLLLFLAVYACFGAYIFLTFEAPTERAEKQLIIDLRNQILNGTSSIQLLSPMSNNNNNNNNTNSTQHHTTPQLNLTHYNKWLSEQLLEYENLLTKACASGITSSSLENQWNFWGALFYSMTVFTTIGYGQLAPITFSGRVATVAYAIFGIPILLMVLADLGKLLTRIIKFTFRKLHHLYSYLLHRKSSIRTRRLVARTIGRYKRAIRVTLSRWLNQITNYLRPPETIRKRLRRFSRKSKPPAEQQAELEEVSNSNPMTTSEAGGDHQLAKDIQQQQLSNGTEVIVTPAKQTKPVSPQPGMHMSPTGLIAGSVTNEPRMGRHHIRHHHHHHHHQQAARSGAALVTANHHTNTAPQHHHQPRQHRSQSPGQGGAAKRKNSMAKHPKGSVSRSSSSSMVVMQTCGATSAAPTPVTDAPRATLADKTTIGNQPVSDKEPGGGVEEHEEEPEEEHPVYESELMDEEELDDEVIEEEEEEDFDIPVSFALFLLVAYMILGASLFGIWEGWDFFSSLYFVFISMSTIGFGDLVPKQQPKRMIGTFIYLLFGLALTSMCINVVQEKIHATFLRAKMQIGEKMGLDLDQIMADDYYEGSLLAPDDYDCQSVTAGSQLNSCSHPAGACCECCSDTCHQHHKESTHSATNTKDEVSTNNNNKNARLSRGSSSLRSRLRTSDKQQPQVGLPAHNNSHSGYSIPFLRKPSGKRAAHKQAASTSSAQVPVASQQESSLCTPASSPSTQETKLVEEAIPKIQEVSSQVTIGGAPSIKCSSATATLSGRARLAGTNSQPPHEDPHGITGKPCKSLSSELETGSGSGSRSAQSAGSSRRSSVSQELNQLDDIIQTLSKSASMQRFGPLLGIPVAAKSRPARTSSPLLQPPAHLMLVASAQNATSPSSPLQRRATSMTHNRPHTPHQQMVSKKTPPTSMIPHRDPQPNHRRVASPAESAIEELEAVKLSFT